MIEERLAELVRRAAVAAAPDLAADPPNVELSRPPQKQFGDFSTNVAFQLASRLKRSPRDVATLLQEHLPQADFVAKAEVAGAGFLNFFLTHAWLHEVLRLAAAEGASYGRSESRGERVQVEFVSANPTGPLHVGTARNAALGDSIANLLEAAGAGVEREYYFNDTGRQMELFGESVEARYLQRYGLEAEVPEGGYEGAYVADLAEAIATDHGDALLSADVTERRSTILEETIKRTIGGIRATLERFGVRFDTWFTERELQESGAVDDAVRRLREAGHAYDAEGAVFFRATDFGDDKDRVLIRSSGEPTYFAKDCAYMLNKAARGFDRFTYIWGADHHGDLKRMLGAAEALGVGADRLDIVMYQLVTLHRGGEPVRMSRRAGDFVTLDELIDEVGVDAARYTLVSRSQDTPIDFDIEEVKRQSLENPVYYVQYAHARIASILRRAGENRVEPREVDTVDLGLLVLEPELDLLRKVAELPEEVRAAAALRAPHRMTRFAEELASQFHRFYTECRVVTDDEELTQARLWVCIVSKLALANVLGLIGVAAPEVMERVPE
jgi:arginyl-tRNA synthetase